VTVQPRPAIIDASDDVRSLIDHRHIVAGTTLVALLYLITEPS
jgi:hypothetical protein